MTSEVNGTLQNCPRLIGLSKPCCFLCDEFVQASSVDFVHSRSQGKIHPWVPPPSTSRHIKQQIIEKLQATLREYFDRAPDPTEP